MGSFRGRLTLLLLLLAPTRAMADACATVRPNWTPGTEATALSELGALIANPVTLVLIVLTALAVRFRKQWAVLLTVVLWTVWVSVLAFASNPAIAAAKAEGCVGSPALFITLVAAICVAMTLYATPRNSS